MGEGDPDGLVGAMTLHEQVSLLSGADDWTLPAIDRLGIGRLKVTDGPNGARGGGALTGGVGAAAFPVGIALGATWSPDLVGEIGAALALEVRDKAAHVLLAPTVNLQRGALNGRNFECYSEDPVLTARLAVAYVAGLQRSGVAATIKHFVGNESEVARTTISSAIDERTLRELYLVPFEAAVKEAGVWAVMTAYNRLNGIYASEHAWLLDEVLRGDWGFDGVVMSDWFGSHSTVPTIRAGLDLEMPGPPRDRGDRLVAAVEAGDVAAAAVARSAGRVVRLMRRCGALDDPGGRAERAFERPEARALVRRAGAEAAVLLKNDGALPLDGAARLAVIGPNARAARIMGGGSAQLNAHRAVSPWDGLAEAVGEARLSFAAGCDNHRYQPAVPGPVHAAWFDNTTLAGEPVHEDERESLSAFLSGDLGGGRVDAGNFSLRLKAGFTPQSDGRHRLGLFCSGRARVFVDGREVLEAWESWSPGTTFFEEGCDERLVDLTLKAGRRYEIRVDYRCAAHRVLEVEALHVGIGLPSGAAEIAAAADLARAADVAILCVGRSAEWDSEGADLPDLALPGDQDALIAAVAGAAQRTIVVLQSGGPVEMPWLDQVSAVLQAWYPGQEAGHAIADVLLGRAEPAGRLPQSFPARLADLPTQGRGEAVYPGRHGEVVYAEGLDIGYRHHAAAGIAPLFAFGHGLSYARIEVEAAVLEADAFEAEGRAALRVRLSNAAEREGSEVLQLYVAPKDPPVPRPLAEMKTFAKCRVAAGGTAEAVLALSPRDFAWYDTGRGAWIVSPGAYELRLGFSSGDIRRRLRLERRGELVLPR